MVGLVVGSRWWVKKKMGSGELESSRLIVGVGKIKIS